MTRRLLELCLLAYPRTGRTRDREFLRDLALDLGATHGFARQAVSLVLGGLSERIRPVRKWARRAAVACVALIALTVAAGGAGSGHEVEEYACVSAGACAETSRLVSERARNGWDCTARRHPTAWECTRESTSWLPL
jgi:hypothetical protein